jgi:methylmalonyl-CoA/ethylmalonyl-CoA epimerase
MANEIFNHKTEKPVFSNLCDIGIVVKDLDKTVTRLEALGIGPFVPAQAPPGAEGLFYRGQPLTAKFRGLVAHLGAIELEIFEPQENPNPWEDFMATKGEGIHHIGFHVDDIEKEVNRLTDQGAEVIMTGKINGQLAAAYIDLKAGGLIIELMNYHNSSENH